jgi:CRP/FNR family transcriptional regulator
MTWTRGTLLSRASPLAECVAVRWKPIQVPLGVELLTQGENPSAAFLLASGLVKLSRSNAAGKVSIVGLRGEGWVLGLSAVILDSMSVISATTMAPCRVHAIPATELRAWLRDNLPVAYAALEMISQEDHEQLAERADLGMRSASARLEQLLWALTADTPAVDGRNPASFHLPLRFGELAQLLSVTPQYLSGLLTALRSRGVIRTSRGALVVSRPDLLRHADEE